MVVPLDFAMPAGLRLIASPSSAATVAAPARAVDCAPAPGRRRPPAVAVVAGTSASVNRARLSFIGSERYRGTRSCIQRLLLATGVATSRDLEMREQDCYRCRRDAADS